jgi:hypothetical protein
MIIKNVFILFLGILIYQPHSIANDSTPVATQNGGVAVLPWKIQDLGELVDIWRKASAESRRDFFSFWSLQNEIEREMPRGFLMATLTLPVEGRRDDAVFTAVIALNNEAIAKGGLKLNIGEKKLVEAIVRRASVITGLPKPNKIEISVLRLKGFNGSIYNGCPCIVFDVAFNKAGQKHSCILRITLPDDPKDGKSLPGLKLHALQSVFTNGSPVADDSGIQDDYQGFIEYDGGSVPVK